MSQYLVKSKTYADRQFGLELTLIYEYLSACLFGRSKLQELLKERIVIESTLF